MVTGKNSFRIDAEHGYTGPGAFAFEVTTATGVNAQNSTKGVTAVLTVPVQVGEDRPILRCPSTSLSVPQSQSITLDVAALCHVWTIDPSQQAHLKYAASWGQRAGGLSIGAVQGSKVTVRAAGDAAPGTTAVLDVSASGSDPGQIRIRVSRAGPPRLIPIHVSDLRYGETRTLDLTRYLISGIRDPRPAVISAARTSGVPVAISAHGTAVTLRALQHVHGRATFRVVISDAGPNAGPERRVQGVLSLDILDVPGAPGRPLTDPLPHDGRVPITFSPAQANGAPILGYEVKDNFGRTTRCGSTSCDVTGLENGRTYHFRVRARNAVGPGPWSGASRRAIPEATPGQVSAVRMTDQGDGYISLAWHKPPLEGASVRTYKVTWTNSGRAVTVDRESATIHGLANDDRYQFTIQAFNGVQGGTLYVSPWFRPMGTPASPPNVAVHDVPQDGGTAQVQVTWGSVDVNGPPGLVYDVYRDSTLVCDNVRSLSCTDEGMAYDGRTYTYTVRAVNKSGNGRESAPSTGAPYQAVGHPDGWGGWNAAATGSNQQVKVTYTVPDSRGAQSTVDVLVDGQVNRTFDERGAQTHLITVPDDDHAYAVSLRVCNEFDRCSTTGGTQSVQAYGPLREDAISSITSSGSGPNVVYTISGNTNGRPAVLTVDHSQSSDTQRISLPAGPFTVTTEPADIGYDHTEQMQAVLDDQQLNRGSDTDRSSGTSGSPPQPSLAISRGDACNDGGGAGPSCRQRGFEPPCTDANCGFVVLTLGSFATENGDLSAGTATCRLSASDRPDWLGRTWTLGNGAHQIDAYYGGTGTVSATCSNDTGARGQSASATFSWPP